MAKKGVVIKLLASYSQDQNRVSKKNSQTSIDMILTSILDKNINIKLWSKMILIMTHVKNVRPTEALKGNNIYKTYFTA